MSKYTTISGIYIVISFFLPITQFPWQMEELNAKGVILKAFDQFRLKTCIDFKQRDSEDYYISVQKLNGYVLDFFHLPPLTINNITY